MGRRIDALPASPIDQRSEASKFRFNLLMLNGCSIGGVGRCAGNIQNRRVDLANPSGGSILFDGAPLITSRVEKIQHNNDKATTRGGLNDFN